MNHERMYAKGEKENKMCNAESYICFSSGSKRDNFLGPRICEKKCIGDEEHVLTLLQLCGRMDIEQDIIGGIVAFLGSSDTFYCELDGDGKKGTGRMLFNQLKKILDMMAFWTQGGMFAGGCAPFPSTE